ncbi:Flp pilus assembly protein CpaB [Acetobacterium sp.]|uniref:Flp pilus assembly protein CpaB n=1 Tax=Acetobacterium sp. TaxID=1872094 RepID=UPI00359477E8
MKKLIIIALVVSIITGIAVFQFATSLEKGKNQETQPVVTAAQSISKGTVIEKEMLTIVEIPVEMVHQLAITNQEDVLGRITKENIEADEQILTSRLSDTNQENNNLSYAIDPNYRGVTILVDEERGVAGYLTKGDRVDLIAVMSDQNGMDSQYVVENIEILEIGPKSTGDKGGEYTSVTLLVPASDVTKLHYAILNGMEETDYRLVLRSPVDNAILGSTPFPT